MKGDRVGPAGSLSDPLLAVLLAVGAGCLFYLTVTDFIPEAEERQYEQSATVAAAVGIVAIFALSSGI
jgi:zinc transporter, ZIP family